MQFGSSASAVFFKMRVAGVLHIFQFDTRQGEDICMALQTHINDIMIKRYSKARPQPSVGAQARAQLIGRAPVPRVLRRGAAQCRRDLWAPSP